jgi:hypothetical protein
MDDTTHNFVCNEVTRQVQPLAQAVAEFKRQNGEQSTLMSMHVRKIEDVDRRLRALYGNGSGPPGFIEIARREDKEWKDHLFSMVDKLTTDRLREEGRASALVELADQKDKRLRNLQKWISLVGVPAGAWVLSLLHPLMHAFVLHFASIIK